MKTGGARLVIVTGGSRGIGAAVARLAAAQGYAVAVNFVRDRSAAQRVVEEIALSGGSAIPIKGDVAQEADIVRLFKEAENAFGPVYQNGLQSIQLFFLCVPLRPFARDLKWVAEAAQPCGRSGSDRLQSKHRCLSLAQRCAEVRKGENLTLTCFAHKPQEVAESCFLSIFFRAAS